MIWLFGLKFCPFEEDTVFSLNKSKETKTKRNKKEKPDSVISDLLTTETKDLNSTKSNGKKRADSVRLFYPA